MDARWCLVHATHMTPGEYTGAAQRRRGRHLPHHRGQPGRWHLRHAAMAGPRRRLGRGLGQPCLRQRGRGTADARVQPAPVAAPAQRAGRPRPAGGHRAVDRRRAGRCPGRRPPVAGLAVGQQADFLALDAGHVAVAGLPVQAVVSAHVFGSHRSSALHSLWVGASAACRPAGMRCTRRRPAALSRPARPPCNPEAPHAMGPRNPPETFQNHAMTDTAPLPSSSTRARRRC